MTNPPPSPARVGIPIRAIVHVAIIPFLSPPLVLRGRVRVGVFFFCLHAIALAFQSDHPIKLIPE
jgi:hypothetical protein